MRSPRALVLFLLLLALTYLGVGCGDSSNERAGKGNPAKTTKFEGAVANPPKPAPPLTLNNSLGQPFELSKQRGKVVLVTFIYTHCPDICPLIVGNLRTAQVQLGGLANQVKIVAVSADPKGDTRKTVKAFLKAHQMTGRMDYLIGSAPELQRTWKTWGIVAKPAKATPEQVEHTGLVYGISATGKITTLYPANFKPAQIVHDVPLLAKQ